MLFFLLTLMVSSFIVLVIFFMFLIKKTGNKQVWLPILMGTLLFAFDFLLVVYVLYAEHSALSFLLSLTMIIMGIGAIFSSIWGVYGFSRVYRDINISRKEVTADRNTVRQYLDVAGVLILVLDRGGNITLINKKGCEILGYSEKALLGKNWFEHFLSPDTVPMVKKIFEQIMKGEIQYNEYYENEVITRSGERRNIAWHNALVYDEKGTIEGTLSSGEDITDRKRAEARLLSALAERKVLLKELHHRTKNNMQVISALLNLQAEYYNDKRLREAFDEAVNRIQAMAMVHEKLYSTDDFSNINLSDYIVDLLQLLADSFAAQEQQIHIDTDLDPVTISLNRAIPLGLMINEIVTNSFKYAFTGRQEGTIRVRLRFEDAMVTLSLEDDGAGVPDGFAIERSESLGIQTILSLGRDQLGGNVSFSSVPENGGTRWVIEFENRERGRNDEE